MVKVSVPAGVVDNGRLEQFKSCEKCAASFSNLYIGGVGDWRTTILCEKCFHVRRGVPYEAVILPLIAQQYGLSLEEARKRDGKAQDAYLALLAKQGH